MAAMVRDAELAKIPYVLTVGQKEVEAHGVAPRKHGEKPGAIVGVDDFIAQLQREAAIPY